jgi:hypothetical protein
VDRRDRVKGRKRVRQPLGDEWQRPPRHRGKLRILLDEGVFMGLGWLTFAE